ncbi:50S ribosomal protein L11 methyltransferase [Desulfovibrio sp. OttesenSCG-928-A18]|nr:50S ribosomal protein L11 methyltransferase [Desulfovibrio sp. OttesenSCG-928-A18]
MPDLVRLACTLPAEHSAADADTLTGLLALHAPHGWEEESLPTGEMRCIVHFASPGAADDLGAVLCAALPRLSLDRTDAPDRDWVEAWKEFFTPVHAGEHFLVLAPWMRQRADERRIPIIIEPKSAFGTGHHASTALCLEAVSALFAVGILRPGMRFLDLGTGSGILGLACAKLGLCGQGLDIDRSAVENALENRELNQVAPEYFQVALGDVSAAEGPFDLVLANILAEPLKDMAPALSALVARPLAAGTGRERAGDVASGASLLLLSGILDIQVAAVEQAYAAQGRAVIRRLHSGEWAALILGERATD